jgi:hypothetical protein
VLLVSVVSVISLVDGGSQAQAAFYLMREK